MLLGGGEVRGKRPDIRCRWSIRSTPQVFRCPLLISRTYVHYPGRFSSTCVPHAFTSLLRGKVSPCFCCDRSDCGEKRCHGPVTSSVQSRSRTGVASLITTAACEPSLAGSSRTCHADAPPPGNDGAIIRPKAGSNAASKLPNGTLRPTPVAFRLASFTTQQRCRNFRLRSSCMPAAARRSAGDRMLIARAPSSKQVRKLSKSTPTGRPADTAKSQSSALCVMLNSSIAGSSRRGFSKADPASRSMRGWTPNSDPSTSRSIPRDATKRHRSTSNLNRDARCISSASK